MRSWTGLSLIVPLALAASTLSAHAAAAPAHGTTATFETTLQTPSGSLSRSGTLTVRTTRRGAVAFTVFNGPSAPLTTPLLAGSDGSTAPDPAVAGNGDSAGTAQAQTLAAELAIGNFAGTGAGTSMGAANYIVPAIIVNPAGQGSPVTPALTMVKSKSGDQYNGSVQISTTTLLPPDDNTDPAVIALKRGTGAALTDTVQLEVTVSAANGRIGLVRGMQTDSIIIRDERGKPAKTITIVQLWAFAAAPRS